MMLYHGTVWFSTVASGPSSTDLGKAPAV